MSKLALGSKARRSLKFIMGVREPTIARSLQPFGFTEQTLEEGWSLLFTLTGHSLAGHPEASVQEPALVVLIDDFENLWFPVARSSLERHHPEVAAQLFVNLSQSQGREAAVTVATFISRLEAMRAGDPSFGPEAKAARSLLAARGLTDGVIAEVKEQLAALRLFKEPASAPVLSEEERQKAEDALWAWYREWSTIARVAIKSRGQLRSLGFRQGQSGAEAEIVAEVPDGAGAAQPSTGAPILPGPTGDLALPGRTEDTVAAE